jgi:amidohydrolase
LPAVKALRRELHRIPEPGFRELDTAARLKEFFSDIPDLTLREGLGITGFTVTLNAGHPGPCIAFRADMDALPIVELTGLAYASERPGWMHACGHDGHSAILAGLVRVLATLRHRLAGPVKFLFQPAEEGGGGRALPGGTGCTTRPGCVHGIWSSWMA